MKRCAEKHGIKPIYRFFQKDELIKYLNMSDLYVHTSEIEIEAISCLEALSCGLVPLINNSPKSATRTFALDEKCLFRLNDANDLAKKSIIGLNTQKKRKKSPTNISLIANNSISTNAWIKWLKWSRKRRKKRKKTHESKKDYILF